MTHEDYGGEDYARKLAELIKNTPTFPDTLYGIKHDKCVGAYTDLDVVVLNATDTTPVAVYKLERICYVRKQVTLIDASE